MDARTLFGEVFCHSRGKRAVGTSGQDTAHDIGSRTLQRSPGPGRVEPQALEVLGSKLDRMQEANLAVHSVYGRDLVLLYWLDKNWLTRHLADVFLRAKRQTPWHVLLPLGIPMLFSIDLATRNFSNCSIQGTRGQSTILARG